MSDNKSPWKNIMVSSGYGHNTHEPFVQIGMEYPKDHPLQIAPDEARNLAMNLLQAAEAAETDEFLFLFATESLGGDQRTAASLLHEYRKHRNEKRGR